MSKSFPLVVAGGVAGAALGAVAWGAISAVTHFQIGFMAIGVGYLTGAAMIRLGGRGRALAIAAAVIAVAGTLAGNLLGVIAVIANHNQVSVFAALPRLTPRIAYGLTVHTFQIMDLVFYAIAAWTAFKAIDRAGTLTAPTAPAASVAPPPAA